MLNMDDMDYLQPSFDPSTLTMPRLRNVLMTHDITYPASAKKTQLVDIFSRELKPQGRKLLAARDRVRRTSRGITNMPSSQEENSVGDDDHVRSSMAPPPVPYTPRQRKPNRSSDPSADDGQHELTETSEKIHSSRRASSKYPRHSDTEMEADLSKSIKRGRPRKSAGPPSIKTEEPDLLPVRPTLPDNAFSDENPFQSGSSPMSLERESDRRERHSISTERRKNSLHRRKSGRVSGNATVKREQEDGVSGPTSSAFKISARRLRNPAVEVDDGIEAGEEFAPEAQLELVRERAANGDRDIFPARRNKPGNKSSVPTFAPWVVLLTLLAGYATWYRQEKIAVGFCEVGKSPNLSRDTRAPEWADLLMPFCEACPPHATCYENMDMRCDHDFIMRPHPLSLGGLLPLPSSCEPDGEKARKIEAVADRAVKALRERRAQAECGTLKDDAGKSLSAEIPEADLKKEVSKGRKRTMSSAEFEELWDGALGEITGREEVVSTDDGRHLSSTSLARLSLGCTIRRSARLALARHRGSLSILILGIAFLIYMRNRIIQQRSDALRVPALVATTLDRLATQAALHTRGDATESWISVGQLRDDILRDVFSDNRRERLWTRVKVIVEKNANVRASVRENKGGDISRVWEWIGSIALLEEPYYDRRRSETNTKATLGDFGETPERISLGGHDDGSVLAHAPSGHRNWNEGRPIF